MSPKFSEISKMKESEREEKIKELKIELMRSYVNSSKSGGSKIKEIKKTIARILTLNKKQE
ncbi:MAG: 50S ribosomal protein L29 [Candidatus Pacearchaeota archaeon]